MDGSRFDRLVRKLTTEQTRRRSVFGLTGAALAGLLRLATVEEASAACVKPTRKGCRGPRHRKCCPGATCQGGNKHRTGTCICKESTTLCSDKCVNLNTDNENCGACGNPCQPQTTCTDGVCLGDGPQGCRGGFGYSDDLPSCPMAQSCYCTIDIENDTICAELFTPDSFCAVCTNNAGCGEGYACIKSTDCVLCGSQGGTACVPLC